MVRVLLRAAAAMRLRPLKIMFAVSIAIVATSRLARAEDVVPPAFEVPQTLTLEDAVRLFRVRGLDLLIAEASVRSAEGQVKVAGAVPNPTASFSWGTTINYDPGNCAQCSTNYWAGGLNDSGALFDSISGKRDLRVRVARSALAAAKMNRVDAERTLVFQVKSAYVQLAQAVLAFRFARDVADANRRTLDVFQTRLHSGAINQGDLARIETQKLEADQALDEAALTLRQARVALAFLMGTRGEIPDYHVDPKVLDYAVPAPLADASEALLLRAAFAHRPDLLAAGYQRSSAASQIALARRQRFPDVTLGINYSQLGTGGSASGGALAPPLIALGVSAPLPVFYQYDGEVRQAEAQYDSTSLQQAKATAQVASDVTSGFAAYVAAKRLVERMEQGGLLRSARVARDITRLQYEKGGASLTDFLDAQRTFIAANVEYFQDLTNYWTAVFQLEQAVGVDLHG